jgi:hypothetical protein
MLGFMPTPYPDEIYYSVLSRYHVYSGNKKTFNTIIDLFGRQVMINVWWQGNLSTITGRFPVLYPLDKETIIYHHTLLPLFSLFMDKSRAEEMIQSTINTNGERILLRSLVGVQGQMDKSLYYCPRCAAHDKDQYGEAYWHRIHQIPGVFICPHHGEFLKKFDIKASNHQVRLRDINMIEHVDLFSNQKSHISGNVLQTLRDVAIDFQYLLKINLKHINIDHLNKRYQHLLIEKKLASPSGMIYREQLIQQFQCFYGIELLEYIGINEKSLLMRFLHKSNRTFPPIFHVLLMRFLAGSAEQFVTFKIPNGLYGNGPWYCLNPAADHYKQRCITDVKCGYSGFTKKPLAEFRCAHCGFTYSQLGVPKSDEEEQIYHRVVEFGPVWENQLRILIQNKVDLKVISEKLGVQPRRVKQIAEFLRIQTEWKPSGTSNSRIKFEEKRSRYRQEWLELTEKNQHLSKSELKELNIGLSTWLFRNDLEWHKNHSPSKKKQYQKDFKRDWMQRDEELHQIIKKIILDWNDKDKPVRVTKRRIFKLVGKSFLHYDRLDKLKKSKAYINSVLESVEDFQIRRIKWAIEFLNKEGHLLTEWRVRQKAHLLGKKDLSPEVLKALRDEIGEGVIK